MKYLFFIILAMVPLCILVFRPRVAKRFNGDFQGIKTEVFIAPVLTLAIFLCSFMGFQTTTAFQKARLTATNEGSAVQQLYETAGLIPNGGGKDLQATSICYARSVKFLDWPATAKFSSSPVTDLWSIRLDREIEKTINAPSPIVSRLLSTEGAQTDTRFVRLADARASLPGIMVFLVVLSVFGAVILTSTFAIASMRRGMVFLIAGTLAFLLAGSLFVVETLDEPYSGIVSIKPSAITKVEKSINDQFEVSYPGVSLPCDAEGNPV